MVGISSSNGIYTYQALKENSPTSGIFLLLLARGGIDRAEDARSQLTFVHLDGGIIPERREG